MADLYFDEDVRLAYADALLALGHKALHARRPPGISKVTDARQLLFAVQHDCVFITHNREDFRLLHDAWRRWQAEWQTAVEHAGILIIPQRVSQALVTEALHTFLSGSLLARNERYEWSRQFGWQHVAYRP